MAGRIYLEDDEFKAGKVFATIAEAAVVAVLGLFIAKFLFFSHTTESKSMEPVILPESVVFINRMAYLIDEPQRFDVIGFSRNADVENADTLIRRVIGLPGETIRIEKGVVYIDDLPLDVSQYTSEITSDGIAGDGIRLGDDEYFVLGDTPANSEDSRSSTVGAVKRQQFQGKAWLTFETLTEMRLIR